MVFPTTDSYPTSLALWTSTFNGELCYGITPPTIFDRFATITGSKMSVSSFPYALHGHMQRLVEVGRITPLDPLVVHNLAPRVVDLRTGQLISTPLPDRVYNLTHVAQALVEDPAATALMLHMAATVTRPGAIAFDPNAWPATGNRVAPHAVLLETSLASFTPGSSVMHVLMPEGMPTRNTVVRSNHQDQPAGPPTANVSQEFLMFMSNVPPFKSLDTSITIYGARPSGFGPGVLDMLYAMGYTPMSMDGFVSRISVAEILPAVYQVPLPGPRDPGVRSSAKQACGLGNAPIGMVIVLFVPLLVCLY